MSFESILAHMNEHHQSELIALCKKYGNPQVEVQNAKLVGVDFVGLDIVYNENLSLRVEFPQKADEKSIKDSIISLCQAAKATDVSGIADEIESFHILRLYRLMGRCISTLAKWRSILKAYRRILAK